MMGYSPSMDMLIVKALTDGAGDDMIMKDEVLAIDANKYDKYLKSNFGIYREGFKKVPTNVTPKPIVTGSAGVEAQLSKPEKIQLYGR